ncbi:DUF4185 domain-containing protein [Streptomyces sp. NPDC050856]|uniref:DUF4185 domain-containing protein n=1 Tax=Streptomyces sp. NPDC050856 TaxID=3154939 RepID=UPI0034119C87
MCLALLPAAAWASARARPAERARAHDLPPAPGAPLPRGDAPLTRGAPPAPGAEAAPAEFVALVAGQGDGDVNRTRDRFAVHATDLGVMWRDGLGRVAVAFGDTYGEGWGGRGAGPATADWRFNTLAHSTDVDLADGMSLDSMVTDRPGHAARILPADPSVNEVTVVPTGAVSAAGRDYLHYMSVRQWGTPGTWTTNHSGLAWSDDGGQSWNRPAGVRWANEAGGSRFQMAALTEWEGRIHLFGTPSGRFGDAYLARTTAEGLLDPAAYEYWTADGWRAGAPDDTTPVMPGPVGELSVQYNTHLGKWLALHLDEDRAAVVARTAPGPTGPWTEGQVVVRGTDHPGLYGGFLHPATTGAEVYFTMSRWDPYHVVLMRLAVDRLT